MVSHEGGYYVKKKIQSHFWVVLGSFVRGGPKIYLKESCIAMDLNKAVPPWRRKRLR